MLKKKEKKRGDRRINQRQNNRLERIKEKILFFNKEYIIVVVILIFAFILRLIYISQLKANDPNFLHLEGNDQGSYDSAARQILEGTFPKEPYYYNPGYYYFLALIYLVFGHNFDTAINVQFVIGLCTYFLTYLIAKQIFNKTVGFIAISLCALYGVFIIYEGLFLSAVLETFLLLMVLIPI